MQALVVENWARHQIEDALKNWDAADLVHSLDYTMPCQAVPAVLPAMPEESSSGDESADPDFFAAAMRHL